MPQKMSNYINKINFGKKIKKLRKDMGLSQDELSIVIGKTRSFISNIENGIDSPGLNTCISFSKFFNVTLDWLIFDYDNNENIFDINERKLIYLYRKMDKKQTEIILKLMLELKRNEQFDK